MARLHFTAALLLMPALTLLLTCHRASSGEAPMSTSAPGPSPASASASVSTPVSAPAPAPQQVHTVSIRGKPMPDVLNKMVNLGGTKTSIPVFRVRTHPGVRIEEKDLLELSEEQV